MSAQLKRREFIALLGGTAASPLAARAQQPTVRVIGFLYVRWPDTKIVATFHKGLNENGYFEGRNLAIEFRSAQNDTHSATALTVFEKFYAAVHPYPNASWTPGEPRSDQLTATTGPGNSPSTSSILHGAPEKVSMKPFSRMPDAATPAVAY